MDPDKTTTDEDLVALALEELSGAQRDEVEAAVGAGGDTSRRYRLIYSLIQRLRDACHDVALFHVSGSRRRRLLALVREQDNGWLAAAAGARQVIATLIHDSLSTGRLAPGFRGGGGPRHLLFESEGLEIDLRVSSRQEPRPEGAASRVRLIGQIAGPSPASDAVARRLCDGATCSIPISQDGVFEGELTGGEYELSFALVDCDVVIPCVDLSSHE